MQPDATVLALAGTIIGLLLGGNVFFVKRLIDQVAAASSQAASAMESAKAADKGVGSLAGLMREIKADIKDLRRVEIDVAVMKSALGFRKPPKEKTPTPDDGETEPT